MKDRLARFFRSHVAPHRQAALRRRLRPVRMGNLRRTQPFSHRYGFDRGTPIDRYYIEQFLARHRLDIAGRGLEVKNDHYLRRFGTNIDRTDILDIDPSNLDATIIADLSAASHVAGEQFDCFALTQTLHLIYDWRGALEHSRRLLRPGGVLLVTVPAVSRVERSMQEIDFWRFTPAACRRVFGEVFGPERVTVEGFGNVLTATAFLMGIAAEELTRAELDAADEFFPVLVGIRAQA